MAHKVVETNTIRKYQDMRTHPYINQYELLSTLGEGMHGKVMLAHDSITNESVAIKVMRRNDPHNRRLPKSNRLGAPPLTAQQETESKIRREIAVMKKCTHQNLVRLREVINDPASKKVYLVMENLEGGEVKWRSKGHDQPVLELSQVQRIMRDVTLGLEYLHHQGIIHRDIKPANLLWTADRQSVKICDFGVSHYVAATAQQDPNLYDEAGLTKTAGSPAFFAPEICHIPDISFNDNPSSPILRRGSRSSRSPPRTQPPTPIITKQIDIWALGVTFYCLLFGTPPWQGQTEFAMFRSICEEEFYLPDTMARDRVPTGGRDRKPEGQEIGWCVVALLEGLLEKDQDKRITLVDIKRIPWIQNGVREPEKWLHETAPNTESRVIVTDEDTKSAIKRARFSYPGWISRITKTFKRVPLLPGFRPSPMGASTSSVTTEAMTGFSPGSSKHNFQSESLSSARSSRTKGAVDHQLNRFTFGNASPMRSKTAPSLRDRRRNSSAGIVSQHSQSVSDPDRRHDRDPGPSNQSSKTACSWSPRRQSDSLQPPGRRFHFGSNTSTSAAPSPTTPDEQPVVGSRLKLRLSRAIRSGSMTKAVKGVRGGRSSRNDDAAPRGRTSAETLDVLRASEDLGLTQAMRASSWGSPGAEDPVLDDDDDGRTSIDLTSSEAGGVTPDFNKSVVRFGAGGYVEGPLCGSSSPGASGSKAGMTHSDSSSNSTATATTPQQHPDAAQHPPRVRSPLVHDCDSGEDEDDLSSGVFDDTGTDDLDYDPDSSDGEVLELRTRRPSAALPRSANASPLR